MSLFYYQFFLWRFANFKVPLIGFLKPHLILLNDEEVVIRLPLTRRSKNHLHSMYFGALSVGADLAGGFHALYYAKKFNVKISLVFKSFEAQFLKRAESDVYFSSKMGKIVEAMIQSSKQTQQRMNHLIDVIASNQEGEVVAKFQVELSVKVI